MDERIQAVFREVFDDPALIVGDTTAAKDIPDWDSMNHLNLIVALEKEFTVQFTAKEIIALSHVGDLKALIAAKRS